MTPQTRGSRTFSSFPPSARRRLLAIGVGWGVAGVAEVAAYTVLALAIVHRSDPSIVLLAAALSLIVTVLCSRAGYLAGARIAGDLYRALGASLRRTRLSWFTQEHRALVSRTAGAGIPSLMGVPAHQLQTFVLAPLVPVLLVGSIAIVSGGVPALLTAALLAVALGMQIFAQRRLARADAARHLHDRKATEATLELVDHLELLRTATTPDRALARTEQAWRSQEAAMRRTNRAAVPATLVSGLAGVLPVAGVLLHLAATGGLADPLAALALVVLTARASAPLDELALAGIAVSELRATADGFRNVTTAPALPAPTAGTSRTPRDNRIELRGVTAPPALEGITACIPERGRVHVAGASGAGKSTLLGLLMRFDDPVDGQVLLGGVPLTALGEDELAARIAYVPQDPVVFTGTIASNIRIGRPVAEDDEIAEAAAKAGLAAVLDRHPAGIHQEVGRHGASLSGGERQRVAIARALVKEAPILILDEGTSALDEATERLIADAVAVREVTVVFVTHRAADIWGADRTIELPGGSGS